MSAKESSEQHHLSVTFSWARETQEFRILLIRVKKRPEPWEWKMDSSGFYSLSLSGFNIRTPSTILLLWTSWLPIKRTKDETARSLVQWLQKTVWQHILKLNLWISYDLAIPVLSIYPTQKHASIHQTHVLLNKLFIAKLFIMARRTEIPTYHQH